MPRAAFYSGISLLLIALISVNWAGGVPKSPQALKPYAGYGSALPRTDADSSLSHDDGDPQYYFPLPDEFDDHYFNVRFAVPNSCRLIQAAFLFIKVPGDTITTLPNLRVLVWPSNNSLPDSALDSVGVDESLINLSLSSDSTYDTTFVSLESLDLHFSAFENFHVGWEPDSTDSTDGQLAILADDGDPSTSYSCEWWGGDVNEWGTMQSDWGLGVNFMIRVLVELYADTTGLVWLDPASPSDFVLQGPFPNPFNPSASFQVELQKPQGVSLQVFDLAGRLVDQISSGVFPAGKNLVTWRPAGLSSGSYWVILKSADETASVKAVLIK